MLKLSKYIIIDLPKKKIDELHSFISETNRRNKDGDEEEEMEMEGAKSKSDEIEKIKQLIIELKFLDQIDKIHAYHEDKIQDGIKMVELVVRNNMDNLNRTKEAFENNEIHSVRSAIKELNRKISKLNSLVKVIDDGETTAKF